MGIAWSRWLDVLHGGEAEGVPPGVPAMVQRAFERYADDNGVMTSKALLRFFQDFQEDRVRRAVRGDMEGTGRTGCATDGTGSLQQDKGDIRCLLEA
ncbi:hypothetical protein CLOM_g5867 [Closterium sp. NIES-68]|nr:hypothetical protein CLOM_g5867 [Closterium sp. NIES-68]